MPRTVYALLVGIDAYPELADMFWHHFTLGFLCPGQEYGSLAEWRGFGRLCCPT